jgi:AP-4 complex subunit mu-1
MIELLNRMAKVFKDYCGVLNEEAVRRNFILIYELLDEMLDAGYPQVTTTEMLKVCVHNEAVVVNPQPVASAIINAMSSRSKPSNASSMPVAVGGQRSSKQKNEIFVDIFEKLTVLFNGNGAVVNSSIDGSIQMKSYLAGNPELRLALNEDLVIGKGNGYGSVVLDDCIFHECVRLDEFDATRTLHFVPPEGEFTLLNYRINGDFRVPFRISTVVEEVSPYKVEIICMIRSEIPEASHASNVTVRFPVPRNSAGGVCELSDSSPGNSAEYSPTEKKVIWSIKKLGGGSEITLRAKIALDAPATSATKREIGPVSMTFEIPMYNVSSLQIRFLQISETHKEYNPFRWVRYVTLSSSYVSRI